MGKDQMAWVSILLVVIAVTFAVLKYYYLAWAVMAIDVALLVYAVKKK